MNPPSTEELKTHPVFGALDQYNLERLLQVGRVDQMRRNETLFSPGDRPDKVTLILDGAVKVTAPAANKREVILDIQGAGDVVGEDAIGNEPRATGAVVMRDAALFSFPAAAVRTLWSRSPEFALAWIRYLAGGKQRLQERVIELAYGNIEDRLFRMLFHLARYHGVSTNKGNTVLKFRLTHQELANLIGATRETTTLAVGRLKSSGALSFMDGKIVLKDRLRSEAAQEERAG
ncbi:MAG TPA: Crp/Fnr family transcriptional regulator [Armatimonadota bacterium]|nr:Crp/Fnr family transcriptional regulator [Armatimonadota bacterium]